MKILFVGLAFSALLYGLLHYVVYTGEEDASAGPRLEDDAALATYTGLPRIHQEGGTNDNLIQLASTSVIDPHQVVWNEDESGVYIVSAEAVSVLNMSGEVRELRTISPKETVLSISAAGVMAVLRDPETVILRDVHTEEEVAVLAMDLAVNSASFSPDARTLALVLDNGSLLRTWDVETGDMLGEFRSPQQTEGAYSVEFASSGDRLLWFSPTGGQALNLESAAFGPPISFDGMVVDVAVDPDGRLLVATTVGLSLWDTETGALLHSEVGVSARSLSYSSRGELLLMTTAASVSLVEAGSGATLHSLPQEALDALFSPSDYTLVIVGADGLVGIWERR